MPDILTLGLFLCVYIGLSWAQNDLRILTLYNDARSYICEGAIDPFTEESWKALTLTTLILGLLQSWTMPRVCVRMSPYACVRQPEEMTEHSNSCDKLLEQGISWHPTRTGV